MATVTIRNLSDEVVAALKDRARRNSRSMEAEVRETLMRSLREDGAPSALEEEVARRLAPQRWTVRGSEVMAWIDANPLTEQEKQVLDDWAADIQAQRENPVFIDTIEDPWERHASS